MNVTEFQSPEYGIVEIQVEARSGADEIGESIAAYVENEFSLERLR